MLSTDGQNNRKIPGAAFVAFVGLAAALVVVLIFFQTSQVKKSPVNNANTINRTLNNISEEQNDENLNIVEEKSSINTQINSNSIDQRDIDQALLTEGFWIPALTGEFKKITSGDTTSYTFSVQNGISIMAATSEEAIKSSLGKAMEKKLQIGSYSGIELSGISEKDGAQVMMVIIYHNDRIFVARGDSNFLEQVKTKMQIL